MPKGLLSIVYKATKCNFLVGAMKNMVYIFVH